MSHQHVRVPYQLIKLDVSNEAKHVYISLLKFRSGVKKTISVSLEKLSDAAGINARQLSNHLTTLVENNVISRSQRKYGMNEFDCNTYKIICDEKPFAILPYEIAFCEILTASSIIAYCIMKQHTDTKKKNFECYKSKEDMSKLFLCSSNHVDKIKTKLKKAGFIEYNRNTKRIVLIFEKKLNDVMNAKTVETNTNKELVPVL